LFSTPSQGLDSAAALSVMSLSKKVLAAGNRAVIATVHQPSAGIFSLFNQVL
ncbi:unnamed protein product, partial [Discosporangium mesarthrocarpum]